MRRRVMQRVFWEISAIVLVMTSVAYGQSLGEVARENREKQDSASASGVQPRMITNASLPKNPTPNQESHDVTPTASPAAGNRVADRRSAQQRLAEERAAEQLRRQIQAQKNKMATMEARIAQLNASIHSPDGSTQYNGPYTRNQAVQLQRMVQIEQQLNEQKRKLDQMQDAARRAGMHSAVYDP
jgi:predicted RNase H-like nuclease (RuvC/YqgF family)